MDAPLVDNDNKGFFFNFCPRLLRESLIICGNWIKFIVFMLDVKMFHLIYKLTNGIIITIISSSTWFNRTRRLKSGIGSNNPQS